MKKLITIMLLMPSLLQAQSDYAFWFDRNGVNVYYKWSCGSCDDRHIRVKIENSNSFQIKWAYDRAVWLVNGQEVGDEVGASWWIKAHGSAAGDFQGQYYYPPKGYEKDNRLTFNFINFKITNGNDSSGSGNAGNSQSHAPQNQERRSEDNLNNQNYSQDQNQIDQLTTRLEELTLKANGDVQNNNAVAAKSNFQKVIQIINQLIAIYEKDSTSKDLVATMKIQLAAVEEIIKSLN